jgi:hypothetical protein
MCSMCVALFQGEGDKTQQAIVFMPLQEIFSSLRATTQLAVHKKNVFAPDQKSFGQKSVFFLKQHIFGSFIEYTFIGT